MSSESRLAAAIFALLVAAIAVPWAGWRWKETHRPRLVAARVVTATAADPVFRDGLRHLGPGEEVTVAVAVSFQRPGESVRWLAPRPSLQIDGSPVADVISDGWPEADRRLRAFWFTIESAQLAGELAPGAGVAELSYRSFLAPEMGREPVAVGLPEAHNDDHLGPRPWLLPVDAGTIRLYARVELVRELDDTRALQAVSSLGPDQLENPGLATLCRGMSLPSPLHGVAGEAFRLPGVELRKGPTEAPGEGATDLLASLSSRRLAVSSRSLAALALTATPELPEDRLEHLDRVTVTEDALLRRGRSLRWGDELRVGDLLRDGERFIVMVADDGNGVLDPADTAMVCWRSPPALLHLGDALDARVSGVDHQRLRPAS